MRRRAFIAGLCGAAVAGPVGVRSQQSGKVFRIGFFGPAITSMFVPLYKVFLDELRVLGFDHGRNLIVTSGAFDDPRGLGAVAAELASSQPELIVVSGTEAPLQAIHALNRGIPI